MRTKLSKVNSDLHRANEKIIELEQKLLTSDKRNQDLQQELKTLREIQSQTEYKKRLYSDVYTILIRI